MELKLEALGNFFDNLNDLEIFPTVGGVNNYCYHVKLNTGERYVLRIYNNGCDYPRVGKTVHTLKLMFIIPSCKIYMIKYVPISIQISNIKYWMSLSWTRHCHSVFRHQSSRKLASSRTCGCLMEVKPPYSSIFQASRWRKIRQHRT